MSDRFPSVFDRSRLKDSEYLGPAGALPPIWPHQPTRVTHGSVNAHRRRGAAEEVRHVGRRVHSLHQNPEWRSRKIRLLRVVESKEACDEVRQHIDELCRASRIAAESVVVVSENTAAAIQATSARAALVILGFEPPEEGAELEFFRRMESFAGELPRVLFVDSAGGMELES